MKKIYFLLFLFFISFSSVKAFDIKTYTRTKEELRVNKNYNINDGNIYNVMITPSVDSSTKIYDFADILEKEEKSKIEKFIKDYKMDMAIVTISEKEHVSTIDFGRDFYDYNDFGIDYDYYSGILLVIDIDKNGGDNRVEIVTTGKAILLFNDSRINHILDQMMNSLYNHNFDNAVDDFIFATDSAAELGMPESAKYLGFDKNGNVYKKFIPKYTTIFFISLAITIIVISVMISKNKMVQNKHSANNYLENSSDIIKTDNFVKTYTTSVAIPKSSSSSGGGGSSFSSGSSGGSHGGGGRSF